MGLTITHKGNFIETERYLKRNKRYDTILERYAQRGVEALSSATPKDDGTTAMSWGYKITKTNKDESISIEWYNTNVNKGVNIAIILQYGHATRNGGYVSGRDYINPALRPIFDAMANEAWKEVKR